MRSIRSASFLTDSLHRLCIKRNSSLFTKRFAFTRDIDESLKSEALTMNVANQKTIDLTRARHQHETLINVLKSVGLSVHNLPSDGFPDSVFIEDTSVIIGNVALITRPGAKSRQGETARVREYLKTIEPGVLVVTDLEDGHVDGGDVLFTGVETPSYPLLCFCFVYHTLVHSMLARRITMHVILPVFIGKEILVGLTTRTDEVGIRALQKAFPNYPVRMVDMENLDRKASISGMLLSYSLSISVMQGVRCVLNVMRIATQPHLLMFLHTLLQLKQTRITLKTCSTLSPSALCVAKALFS